MGNATLMAWFNTVVSALTGKAPLIFRFFIEKESSTYTYILADARTKEAVIIDPVLETAERYVEVVQIRSASLIS